MDRSLPAANSRLTKLDPWNRVLVEEEAVVVAVAATAGEAAEVVATKVAAAEIVETEAIGVIGAGNESAIKRPRYASRAGGIRSPEERFWPK